MKNYPLPLLFVLTLLFYTSTALAQTTYKALFLGNSYTYSNNLPDLINSIANSLGDTLIYDSNTPGGHTLEGHAQNPTSISKINSQDWDFVILQDQSQRPSFPQAQVAVQVYPYAAILDSIIEANDTCTETVFFMTWGRRFGDQQNCATWPPVCTFDGMQAQLRESYLNMANDNDATCAPVGAAWKHAIDTDPSYVLHSGDNSHPALMGSYLSACVFYTAIFRKSPVGASFTSTLTAAQANYLQQIAHDVAFDSMSAFNIGANLPTAHFDYTANGNNVQFTNNSTGDIDSIEWNFGDGSPVSNQQTPQHTYNGTGTFNVTLTAYGECDTHTVVQSIVVSPFLNIETHSNQAINMTVFPNPSSGIATFEFSRLPADGLFQIIDGQGKVLLTETIPAQKTMFRKMVDLTKNATGLYHYQLTCKGQQYSGKLIHQ